MKTTNSKQTSAPLIVVCLCHDDGATRRQWQPQWEVQRVAEGSVEGVGPLRCRRGNQLTKSRGNARQEGARGLWGRNRRRGSLCWGCRELPEAVATRSDLHGERRAQTHRSLPGKAPRWRLAMRWQQRWVQEANRPCGWGGAASRRFDIMVVRLCEKWWLAMREREGERGSFVSCLQARWLMIK